MDETKQSIFEFDWDNKKVIWVADNIENLLGYSVSEFMELNFDSFIYNEDKKNSLHHILEGINKREFLGFKSRVYNKDETLHYVYLKGCVLENNNHLISIRCIEDEYKLNKELQKETDLLKMEVKKLDIVMEHSDVFVLKINFKNKKVISIDSNNIPFGYDNYDEIYNLINSDDQHLINYNLCEKSNIIKTNVIRIKHKNGKYHLYRISGLVLEENIHLIAIKNIDVEEKLKILEEERKKTQSYLDHEVKQKFATFCWSIEQALEGKCNDNKIEVNKELLEDLLCISERGKDLCYGATLQRQIYDGSYKYTIREKNLSGQIGVMYDTQLYYNNELIDRRKWDINIETDWNLLFHIIDNVVNNANKFGKNINIKYFVESTSLKFIICNDVLEINKQKNQNNNLGGSIIEKCSKLLKGRYDFVIDNNKATFCFQMMI